MTVSEKKPTHVIDLTEALELLRRARDEKGADYIDPRVESGEECQYATSRGRPLCIVGHAFHYARVNLRPIWNAPRVSELFEDTVRYKKRAPDDVLPYRKTPKKLGITREALEALQIAQRRQDDGKSWGRAVEDAERGEK